VADPIIAVDLNAKRLALGRELGATYTINNGKTELAKRVRAIAGAGIDHIVESTGDIGLYRTGLDMLNPGGSMALLAGNGQAGDFPNGRKVLDVIQGDAIPQEFTPRLIRYYRQGRFPFDRLVKFYDFAQINQAIADQRQDHQGHSPDRRGDARRIGLKQAGHKGPLARARTLRKAKARTIALRVMATAFEVAKSDAERPLLWLLRDRLG